MLIEIVIRPSILHGIWSLSVRSGAAPLSRVSPELALRCSAVRCMLARRDDAAVESRRPAKSDFLRERVAPSRRFSALPFLPSSSSDAGASSPSLERSSDETAAREAAPACVRGIQYAA
mgnify:CR=1 FL=1